MTANAFAISRRLVEKGVGKQTADAVAEEIVTHSDESLATKADVARLETKQNVMIVILVAVLVGLIAIYIRDGGG